MAAANRAGELSVERVVEEAERIVGSGGLESLTMRRLAESLGTTAMSLYRHVRDKDDLVERIVDRRLGTVADREHAGGWREGLAALHGELRRVLLEDEGVARAFIGRPSSGPNQARILERMLEYLVEGGFRGPDVVIASDALYVYTLGSVCHDATRPVAEWPRHLARAEGATPRLAEHARYLQRREPDVMFAVGHAAVLAGLEALLVREQAEGSPAE